MTNRSQFANDTAGAMNDWIVPTRNMHCGVQSGPLPSSFIFGSRNYVACLANVTLGKHTLLLLLLQIVKYVGVVCTYDFFSTTALAQEEEIQLHVVSNPEDASCAHCCWGIVEPSQASDALFFLSCLHQRSKSFIALLFFFFVNVTRIHQTQKRCKQIPQ